MPIRGLTTVQVLVFRAFVVVSTVEIVMPLVNHSVGDRKVMVFGRIDSFTLIVEVQTYEVNL